MNSASIAMDYATDEANHLEAQRYNYMYGKGS